MPSPRTAHAPLRTARYFTVTVTFCATRFTVATHTPTFPATFTGYLVTLRFAGYGSQHCLRVYLVLRTPWVHTPRTVAVTLPALRLHPLRGYYIPHTVYLRLRYTFTAFCGCCYVLQFLPLPVAFARSAPLLRFCAVHAVPGTHTRFTRGCIYTFSAFARLVTLVLRLPPDYRSGCTLVVYVLHGYLCRSWFAVTTLPHAVTTARTRLRFCLCILPFPLHCAFTFYTVVLHAACVRSLHTLRSTFTVTFVAFYGLPVLRAVRSFPVTRCARWFCLRLYPFPFYGYIHTTWILRITVPGYLRLHTFTGYVRTHYAWFTAFVQFVAFTPALPRLHTALPTRTATFCPVYYYAVTLRLHCTFTVALLPTVVTFRYYVTFSLPVYCCAVRYLHIWFYAAPRVLRVISRVRVLWLPTAVAHTARSFSTCLFPLPLRCHTRTAARLRTTFPTRAIYCCGCITCRSLQFGSFTLRFCGSRLYAAVGSAVLARLVAAPFYHARFRCHVLRFTFVQFDSTLPGSYTTPHTLLPGCARGSTLPHLHAFGLHFACRFTVAHRTTLRGSAATRLPRHAFFTTVLRLRGCGLLPFGYARTRCATRIPVCATAAHGSAFGSRLFRACAAAPRLPFSSAAVTHALPVTTTHFTFALTARTLRSLLHTYPAGSVHHGLPTTCCLPVVLTAYHTVAVLRYRHHTCVFCHTVTRSLYLSAVTIRLVVGSARTPGCYAATVAFCLRTGFAHTAPGCAILRTDTCRFTRVAVYATRGCVRTLYAFCLFHRAHYTHTHLVQFCTHNTTAVARGPRVCLRLPVHCGCAFYATILPAVPFTCGCAVRYARSSRCHTHHLPHRFTCVLRLVHVGSCTCGYGYAAFGLYRFTYIMVVHAFDTGFWLLLRLLRLRYYTAHVLRLRYGCLTHRTPRCGCGLPRSPRTPLPVILHTFPGYVPLPRCGSDLVYLFWFTVTRLPLYYPHYVLVTVGCYPCYRCPRSFLVGCSAGSRSPPPRTVPLYGSRFGYAFYCLCLPHVTHVLPLRTRCVTTLHLPLVRFCLRCGLPVHRVTPPPAAPPRRAAAATRYLRALRFLRL